MSKQRLGALGALAILVFVGVLASVPAAVSSGLNALPAAAPINGGDTAWMLMATAMVLLMTPGLAFFYGGMVSKQHVIGTMFQSFIAMGVVSLLWVVVGFSLSFGTSFHGLIGDPRTFFMFRGVGLTTNAALSPTIPFALFALFQMKFAIITPALVTGSFAERIKFSSFIWFMILFTVCVYAPLAHWTWHPDGFLRQWGILDFAGGTVVHMSAGFAGLAGALAVRHTPPRGAPSGGHSPQVPANIPFVLLGTGLLWFGWFGFNAGSELAADGGAVTAFLTTNTAAAAAMVAWLLTDLIMGRHVTALNAGIGSVVGLVAVTPAAGFVTVGASIAIGTVAALVSNLMLNAQWLKARIPDTLDVFACHGVGGMVGMILTAVFALKGGLVSGDPSLLFKHLAAVVIVAVYAFGMSLLLYKALGFIGKLNTSSTLGRSGAAFDMDLGDLEGLI